MSTIIMARCWPLRLPAVPKFVLVSLADQANDQAVCWPSVQTLADRTGYSVRAVQNALRWLEEQGLLYVEIGGCKSNRYTLRVERYRPDFKPADPASGAPPNDVHPRTSCTIPPQEVHPNRKGTSVNTPPISPKGDQSAGRRLEVEGGQTSAPLSLTLPEWLDSLKADGKKPIAPNDPVFEYTDRVGITDEMLTLHWRVFKSRHIDSGKRQRDWRRKLLTSIKGNWYRLWYASADGSMRLSTQGVQAQREWGDGQ